MLGEMVDYGFDTQPGSKVGLGQTIGWIEGLKAVSDLPSAVEGTFEQGNSQLSLDPESMDRDCYGVGWIYEASGKPDSAALDVQRYKVFLDCTIDALAKKRGT
jgi:glycine cleavage system H protein